MTNLIPGTRLKIKGDTFFLPFPNESVYFRNNNIPYGRRDDRPVVISIFNGGFRLAELTDGLSDPNRERVLLC